MLVKGVDHVVKGYALSTGRLSQKVWDSKEDMWGSKRYKDPLYFFSSCFPDLSNLGIIHPLFQTGLNF